MGEFKLDLSYFAMVSGLQSNLPSDTQSQLICGYLQCSHNMSKTNDFWSIMYQILTLYWIMIVKIIFMAVINIRYA